MQDYKKLTEFMLEKKDSFLTNLTGAILPKDTEKIKRMSVEYMESLTKRKGDYMNQLSLLEQDLLKPIFEIIENMNSIDLSYDQKLPEVESNKDIEDETNKRMREMKSFTPAIFGAAAGSTTASIIASKAGMIASKTFWPVLLASAISAFIGKVLFDLYTRYRENKGVVPSSSTKKTKNYKLSRNEAELIFNALLSIGNNVDNALLIYRSHIDILQNDFDKKLENTRIEKQHLDVIEALQSILGNLKSMEMTPRINESIKLIKSTLLSNGFKAVSYSDENAGLFQCKTDDVDSIEEFKPAIIMSNGEKETLILRGGVVLPRK